MTKAIVVHTTGGPEQMVWEDVTVGKPGPGQVRLRHTAVGLNYVDVYFRTGIYKAPSLPFTPGMEGAGVIEEVGPDVSDFRVGDRVAYASHPVGAYAEVRLMPADRLVLIPEAVTDQQAASLMLQGMTAQYLLRRVYPVQRGETILIHAAAGGPDDVDGPAALVHSREECQLRVGLVLLRLEHLPDNLRKCVIVI